jgi:hypothetical protein
MKARNTILTLIAVYFLTSTTTLAQDNKDDKKKEDNDKPTSVEVSCENKSLVQCASQCISPETKLCLNDVPRSLINLEKQSDKLTSELINKNTISYKFRDRQKGIFLDSTRACLTNCSKEFPGEMKDIAKDIDTKKETSSSINSADYIWANRLLLGVTRQSSYNEEGENEGLTETSSAAQFTFNARWFNKCDKNKDKCVKDSDGEVLDGYGNFITQLEFGITLSELAATNPTEPDGDADNSAVDPKNPPDPEPLPEQPSTPDFNDVAGTLDAYAKFSISPWDRLHSDDYRSIGSFGVITGFRTRDTLTEDNNDGVSFYYGPIFDLNFYPKDIRKEGNNAPRGAISLAYVQFEEFGGVQDEWRWVLNANWKLSENSPVVAGIRANLGEGDDDVGIFLGIQGSTNDVFKFFGLSQ